MAYVSYKSKISVWEKNQKDKDNLNEKLLKRPMVEEVKNNQIILLWTLKPQNWNIQSNLSLNAPFLTVIVSRFSVAEVIGASV